MQRSWLLPFLLLTPVAAQAPTKPLAEDRAGGAALITEARLREFLGTLASPEFGGRGTGQPGFERAATYVADHFRSLGLQPLGDDGTFWQRVPWTQISAVANRSGLKVAAAQGALALGVDALAGTIAFRQEAAGDAVHIVIADATKAVFAPESLAGQVAFVEFPGVDLDEAFAGANRREWSRLMDRLRSAGAAGVIVVDDARFARLGGLSGPSRPGAGAPAASRAAGRNPNELYVTRAVFDKIAALGSPGSDTAESDVRPLTGVRVELTIEVANAPAPAFNVVGRLPGSDPTRAGECVVIGSHLDHLGIQRGVLHPGADDDGSGSTGVMALAEAFAKNPVRPARSIVFVAFCGEENGLIGSRHFSNNPPIELSSIVAELQMDMIGRDEEGEGETAEQNVNSLHLVGTEKLSRDLHALCLEMNTQHGGFDLEWDEEGVFFRSDHVNFARKGVPIAFFFTGFHKDYHRPSDTPEKINYPKMQRIATYVYALGFELAQQRSRPLVDEDLWQQNRDKLSGAGEPAAPVRKR